ncbi:MAG: phospho-sugar mutase [Oscillospiraceae bacterium]|nr:phospho-sugar mutase [Oscillospiraceae bacterium]
MDYRKEYEKWLAADCLSENERAELLAIKDNEKEIEDRFFAPLKFGTAGLRGVLGMGLNRMNVYTVRQATQGLADLICDMGKKTMEKGVAICMDCRNMSDVFAKEAASVLAANGIKVYLFESLRPTPELSFVIRALECIAGINITASHNPKEYNGYKAYWADGAQLPPKEADVVLRAIEKTDIFTGAKTLDYDKAVADEKIIVMGEEVDEAFLVHVLGCAINREAPKAVADDFKIVYTPFHGTGHKLVPEILSRIGLYNVIPVPEQMVIDGNFPTVKSPNPENREGFALAIELAKRENVDLIIGTDPDADRVGVVVRNNSGEYVTISGNQMGVLLLDYIIGAKKRAGELSDNAYAVKTIVTTEMARKVCEENNVKIFDTFTGFKFIAAKIEEEGSDDFLMGYEESYGYLIGDFCRDKDAVTASMMIAEMAAYYKTQNMSLYDAMQKLYEKYGAYSERTINVVMPGVSGLENMKKLMEDLRTNPPETIADAKVSRVRDYLAGKANDGSELHLSGSDVLYFEMEDDTRFIIRPSGTEPKIKVYVLAKGDTVEAAEATAEKFAKAAEDIAK